MKLDPEWVRTLADKTGFRPTVLEELCAGKFCALLSRSLPRDLFDMTLLPEIAGDIWRTERLRKILIAISAVLHHPLTSYGQDRLERVTDKMIEQQLRPMLTGEAPGAAELKARVWSIVEPFLELEPEEREYIELVQRGELRPELLVPDDELLADRLRRHPALRWKVENARRRRSSGGLERRKDHQFVSAVLIEGVMASGEIAEGARVAVMRPLSRAGVMGA